MSKRERAKEAILITGASGFVGSGLLKHPGLKNSAILGRTDPGNSNNKFYLSELSEVGDYKEALKGKETVIHLAARAHVMNDSSENASEEYMRVNTRATLNLAQQAANVGVKRFIFLSTIKVNGESTEGRSPYTNEEPLGASDPYGASKAEAEILLLELAEKTEMEVVIIRSPLVYGPGVKANFLSLMKLADKNFPLPLGEAKGKRSLVYIDNLVSLIWECVSNSNAANKVFLVSDDNDVTVAELLSEMTTALGKRSRIFNFPVKLLEIFCRICRKEDVFQRLFGSLQVDISNTKKTLRWMPPVSFSNGIKITMLDFKKISNRKEK